jgi:hypothetical protein
MDKTLKARFWLMAALVASAAAARLFPYLIPYPFNFAPVTAIALFGGAHFDRKAWAFAAPLAAMLLGDLLIELLFARGIHAQMPVVYLSFAAIVGLGFLLRGRRRLLPVTGAALTASGLFFLTTNFGVWVEGALYPRTLEGLVACYVAAIPFFGATLAGDLFYTAALFGAFALAERGFPVLSLPKAASASP